MCDLAGTKDTEDDIRASLEQAAALSLREGATALEDCNESFECSGWRTVLLEGEREGEGGGGGIGTWGVKESELVSLGSRGRACLLQL